MYKDMICIVGLERQDITRLQTEHTTTSKLKSTH